MKITLSHFISRLQRSNMKSRVDLGRWPRLLHCAPAALKLGSHMRFVLPFTEQDVRRGEQVPLTPNLVAKATFEGIRAAFNYWIFCLRPVLQGLVNPTPREQSFLGLFHRAIGYVASIRKLNHAMHVQSIAASARSLFEIGVDIALFHQDGTNESSNRIEAFTRVERYRVAQKLVEYYSNRPLPPDLNLER